MPVRTSQRPPHPTPLNAACALRMQRGSARVQQDAAMPFELEHVKSCAKTQVRKHFPCPAASPTSERLLPSFLPSSSTGRTGRNYGRQAGVFRKMAQFHPKRQNYVARNSAVINVITAVAAAQLRCRTHEGNTF